MRTAHALVRLSRLSTSALISLAVFIPSISRTRDLGVSLRRTVPLLFIAMCTFIVNDLDDVEKDIINHPERPLPAGQLTTSLAAVAYFVSLACALFTTRAFIMSSAAFWYYLLLTLSISYGYVVEWFPGFKAPYVAGAISIPVLIAATFHPTETKFYVLVLCIFLLSLGRELCQDIIDRAGDSPSFMSRIGAKPIAAIAFSSQAIGIILLATESTNLISIAVVVLMAAVLLVCSHSWFKLRTYRRVIALMKLNFVIGMYFLV